MSWLKTCDKCGFARQRMVDGEVVSAVIRYTLRREIDQTRTAGRRTKRLQKSAGGIDLCDECWTIICKPRTNPNKGAARRVSAA